MTAMLGARRANPGWMLVLCALVISTAPWSGSPARAQDMDYTVVSVKPDLVADEATTLLLDFSKPGNPVGKFTGRQRPDVSGLQRAGDAVRGTMSIPTAGCFDPSSFTIEMVLRIPAGNVPGRESLLARWDVKDNYTGWIRLADARLYGNAGRGGRQLPFLLSMPTGGNGRELTTQGVGQWICLAMGVDLKSRRGAVVTRQMDGSVLGREMQFASPGQLHQDFANGLPPAQAEASIRQCWQEMLRSVQAAAEKGEPATLTLGHPGVDIQRVRISRGFREQVLIPRPQFGSEALRTWSATDLDPKRTQVLEADRTLGYRGYRNYKTYRIAEPVLPLAAGDAPVTLALPKLDIGVYSMMLYGTIDPAGRDKLDRIWKPCPIEFELLDRSGKQVSFGRLLAKQSLRPCRLQGFHLVIDEAGDYTLRIRLADRAMERVRLIQAELIDQLAGLPLQAVKTKQTLEQPEATMRRLERLDGARLARDRDVWSSLPPLNVHMQMHQQVKPFTIPPQGMTLPRWQTKAFVGQTRSSWGRIAIAPLDLVNEDSGEVITQDRILRGDPLPGPYGDDGAGIFLTKSEFNDLPHDIYLTPRAQLLGMRAWLVLGLLGAHDHRSLSLARKYFETGDPQIGHDAALLLVRVAHEYPALEMNLHEIRLSTHSPDLEFNTDWSQRRNGKFFYEGWSGNIQVDMLTAYDQLFPYIKDNQVFADAVHRFVPWVKTPQDVVAMLDQRLVFAGVRDFNEGRIRAAPVEDFAARVLGPSKWTASFFDLTRQHAEIYPYKGTYQELYGTALSRCGSYYIASFMVYAFGSAQDMLLKAALLADAKAQGVQLAMDLSDAQRYRKVLGASDFLLDMWPAGGFPFMVGDASGSTHSGLEADKRLKMARDAVGYAFRLTGDPRHAWVLANKLGSKDPAAIKAAAGQRDPILHAPSRVVPDWGAIIELNPDEADVLKKTAATLRLGIGQGHAHADFLDLNLFGMGLPLAVDLACRSEGSNWSRPSASWSFLHNHAIAHDDENPRNAGGQDGEPWLTTFSPPLARASYADGKGDATLDRDVFVMAVGDTGQSYTFDLQRLRGGKLHTWCFHGCESEDIDFNTTMTANTVRWIDRTLAGTHKTGKAPATLTAVWTMTREGREIKHDFNGGGVIKTTACEPAALRDRYDAKLPRVKVKATLLDVEGDAVMQGSPFSQAYSYAFPFLWVQRSAREGGSTYPAVYEAYRGDQPVVRQVKWVGRSPDVIEVTTTSGQVDRYTSQAGGRFVVESRDPAGQLRYVKVCGVAGATADSISIEAEREQWGTTVADIDHVKGTLTTRDPLPQDAAVIAGGEGRRTYLQLKGEGRNFTFRDDLLVHEGEITDIKVSGDRVDVTTNQRVFRGDSGNRKLASLTTATEDHAWMFRNGVPVRQPAGARLSDAVFTDANGDGKRNLKTYDLGPGDPLVLAAAITLERTAAGWRVQSNVAGKVTVAGRSHELTPTSDWKALK